MKTRRRLRQKVLRHLPMLLLMCIILVQAALPSSSSSVPKNPVWPRPVVVPEPLATAGVRHPVISLGGAWKISIEPPADCWSDSVDPSAWSDVRVPGHLVAQGIVVPPGQQYAYKRQFTIPAGFQGKRILLEFEGVTGLAKVWVNGAYLRDHFGGFTTWQCDITDLVRPGTEAWLTVGITDETEGISPFNNGGILRDVKLMAVPQDYVTRFTVETILDEDYREAVLRVWLAMAFHYCEGARVDLKLRDPDGTPVELQPSDVELTRENPETIIEIPVSSPAKWDAEHPHLYTLEARVVAVGATAETLSRNVGFRNIERVGRKLLVNGREVKLRGVNRKDISPFGARSVPPDLCDLDARLFREANVNFIRTSHYPTNEEFLDACDRYGMYVESETSVSFARGSVVNDPALLSHFMDQFAEMIERDRSHASVIMWSTANESAWGSNIAEEVAYARAEDPTRPLIFSWGNRVPSTAEHPYNIYSYHYVSCRGDLAATAPLRRRDVRESGEQSRPEPIEFPVLHDEYAHVACYNLDEQRRDPNVRSFWGESIKLFWERIFQTEGALGGAIWAGLDNMSFVPEGVEPVSRYEWGILDSWRRKKPEYWLTKKAYSPVRIEDEPIANPGSGKPLDLPIRNRFDHTNLRELRILWKVGEESGTVEGPDVEPHFQGMLRLPARNWADGDVLNLRFCRLDDILVDEYNLPINPPPTVPSGPQGPAPRVEEDQDRILLSGADFSLVFSKQTGLITRGTYKGIDIIESGPYIHLEGLELGDWSLDRITVARETKEAVGSISGSCGPARVSFEVRVDGGGLITVKYSFDALPETTPDTGERRRRQRACSEVGVSFVLTDEVDRLAWKRKGLWSAYPADHTARNTGMAQREGHGPAERYGQAPSWPWSEDERDYPLNGRHDVGGAGTNDFRSMKEHILHAAAIVRGTRIGLEAESDGSDAVRLEVLDDPSAMIDDRDARVKLTGSWTRADDSESYESTISRSGSPGDSAEVAFTGTGICWLGTLDLSGGTADVYLDGKLEIAGLSLQDYQAQAGAVVFSREGLADGSHTLRIVCTSRDGSQLSLDGFRILGGTTRGPVRFIIDNEWNYPGLAWGNYVKDPIFVGSGYENQVRLRFRDNAELVPEGQP